MHKLSDQFRTRVAQLVRAAGGSHFSIGDQIAAIGDCGNLLNVVTYQNAGYAQRSWLWANETQRSLDELAKNGVKIIKADQSKFRMKSTGVVEKYATGARKVIVERIQQVEK